MEEPAPRKTIFLARRRAALPLPGTDLDPANGFAKPSGSGRSCSSPHRAAVPEPDAVRSSAAPGPPVVHLCCKRLAPLPYSAGHPPDAIIYTIDPKARLLPQPPTEQRFTLGPGEYGDHGGDLHIGADVADPDFDSG
jgi:hypothetical protein